ncbi:cupin domain-containing protein [Paraburkholderia sp. Ac-20340]|uniref:cupin domain-containing protein n=1 Tax=Paraburkholderia sp. Ac-20340 TaxID=2703888 RepID=UPI00197D5D31|nr:cupin domain-containing protein [Paraburkholderia sp. Ac-20340]MBN3852764.1 cupin domain-containing protein [Paraburkholderia sp. Ac-20340]
MAVAHNEVEELIRRFGLEPHPEGGYYSETYRADTFVQREGATPGEGTRAASTAIYFLLAQGAYSAWHRIRSDELWHFYAGSPIEIHSIDERGVLSTRKLGHALDHPGTVFQAVVPAGHWFAARCCDPSTYALVGCTVAPGFEFSEFEIADVDALIEQFPLHRALIELLGKRATVAAKKD